MSLSVKRNLVLPVKINSEDSAQYDEIKTSQFGDFIMMLDIRPEPSQETARPGSFKVVYRR
jgi:hypothetical protein